MNIKDVVGKDAPQDLYIAFQHASFYLKETPNGDVLSIICPPDIAILIKNNAFLIRDKLKKYAERKLSRHLKIEVALDEKTLEVYNEKRTEKEEKGNGIIVPDDSGMNKQFTFDNFRVSSCNESAYKTALLYASGKAPYKLLFIYGNYGVGKSHLLNAIGNMMLSEGKKVAFFNNSTFIKYVVAYTRSNNPSVRLNMIKDVKSADIFLLDDLHLLRSKTVTQEELKFIIDYFISLQKPMAFTSLYNINELEKIGNIREEIISRFHEGMPVYVSPPDHQLKFVLLQKYLSELRMDLPENTIKTLASIEMKNVREIQSLANTIHNVIHTYGNISEKELFGILTSRSNIRIPAVEEREVSKLLRELGFGSITVDDLKNKNLRYNREIRAIRNAVIKHLADTKKYSKADIARIFGLTRASITIILKKYTEGKNK